MGRKEKNEIFGFNSSSAALDFVGVDQSGSARGGGGGRRNKFSRFYSALASGESEPRAQTPSPKVTFVQTTSTLASPVIQETEETIEEGLDARALAPVESTFQVQFEDFDPLYEAESDPVYQETMAKLSNLIISINQINNFGRGDFKLTQTEIARKLVADNSFKQLDKFTKLMQMIMYLQYEPVFSKYCFYGCWCMPAGGADITKTWGQPVDEIDSKCRDRQMCYKCAKMDYGSTCKETNGYSFKGYINKSGDRAIRCTNKRDTCSRALCECDKKLAEDLSKLEDTATMAYSSKYGTFNFKNECVAGCTNCRKWDSCCGKYPERYP